MPSDIKECSLYSFTLKGQKVKTTPADLTAREGLKTKQNALTTAQLAACNSGITAAILSDILSRLTALEGGS